MVFIVCSLTMRVLTTDLNNRSTVGVTKPTFQADILRVFQLNDFVKSSIYIIQTENFKIFIILMRLK